MYRWLNEVPDFVDWQNPVADHPLNAGLVAWWLAGPDPTGYGGNKWIDLCGKHHGTLTNMDPETDWVGTTRPGGWGALDFDGSNDYVSMGAPSRLTNLASGSFSVSAWIRPDTTGGGGTGRITNKRPAGAAGGWLFFTDGTASLGSQVINTSAVVYAQSRGSANAIALGAWQHVTMVFAGAGSVILIYVNEREITYGTQTTGTGTIGADTGGNLLIGDSPTDLGTRVFDGQMDDLRIYNRALTAAEVAQLYQDSRQYHPNTLRRISLPRGYAPQQQFQAYWAARATQIAGINHA